MRTLIASNEDLLADSIRQELLMTGCDGASCQIVRFKQVVQQLGEFKPTLVVLVLPPEAEQGRALLVELRRLLEVPIFVFGPADDPKLILRILHAGGSEYLDATDCRGEMQGALQRLQAQLAKREATGKIVAVVSACGGSGASTVAANLAAVFAADCTKSLIVDLVLENGILAALFDLHPTYALTDLCQNNGLIDRGMVERSLARHDSGVYLLASPRMQDRFLAMLRENEPAARAPLGTDALRQTLALSRYMFPYIVIDQRPTFSEEQVQALRSTDVVLIVFRLGFSALRNVQRHLEHLDLLALPRDKVRLIANRTGQPKEIPVEKVSDALKMPIFHMVPDDVAAVNRASNFGVPAVLDAPRSKIASSFCELARKLRASAKSADDGSANGSSASPRASPRFPSFSRA